MKPSPEYRIDAPLHEVDYCKITTNGACQAMCRGCEGIQALLVQQRGRTLATRPKPVYKIHRDFMELERCAERCVACQVIRRALLLKQITQRERSDLRSRKMSRAIFASLGDEDTPSLTITIEAHTFAPRITARVLCNTRNTITTSMSMTHRGHKPDMQTLKGWIDSCHMTHSCRELRRSLRNPSWLLQILGGNKARVVQGPEDRLVKYIVLSYSWGDPESPTMSRDDWKRIKGAATQRGDDGEIIPERATPFPRNVLPETMQDSIDLAENLGIEYIWIDSICLPKGSDWDYEATKMHEVYGNAQFTLCACSSRHATDRMLTTRDAWLYPTRGCRIDKQWLYTASNPLSDVRLRAPTADRGWILQEERLSPRILYWTSQEAYWSCAEAQHVEPSRTEHVEPAVEDPWSPSYRFLQLCRRGEVSRLEEEWLDVVESYTRKGLAKGKDRFIAIAGLATCYFEAGRNPGSDLDEEYLAGLWRSGFARQLTWVVDTASRYEDHLLAIAPSWSWASLPLRTKTHMRHSFTQAAAFQVLEPYHTQRNEDTSSVIVKGANVKSVAVRGRLRPFLPSDAKEIDWSHIAHLHQSGSEVFTFADQPDQSVFSLHAHDGRIVSYEAHKEEVVGQLDYIWPDSDPGHSTADSARDLYCLEVGEAAMLLVRPVSSEMMQQEGAQEPTDQRGRYSRVGVCHAYRSGFFRGSQAVSIVVV